MPLTLVVALALAASPSAPGDLEAIKARGVLRVLVHGDEEGFLPRAGSPRAQDRELAEAFATKLGIKAEVIPVESFDALFTALLEGKGDLVAGGITITPSRRAKVDFSQPVGTVSELVVGQRGAKGLPRSVEALNGATLHVRPGSAFAETLQALRQGPAKGLKVEEVPETVETEQLLYDVGRGVRPLTVADSNLVASVQSYDPDIEPLFAIAEGRQLAWALRPNNPALKAALNEFLLERALTSHTQKRFTGDLDGVKKRGVLRVLTFNNAVSYFLHRGQPMGFEYELARMLAAGLGVRLEMVVPPSHEQLLPWLLEGRGDVIAASLTVTPERARQVRFSRPYLLVDELLVQPSTPLGRSGARPRLSTKSELAGKRVAVRQSSSYAETLKALKAEGVPLELVAADESLETEELIDQVADGTLDFTVADSHLLQAERVWRDDVEAAFPLVTGKQIAFAVRPTNPKLLAALDAFVQKTYRGLEYNVARKRYFEDRRTISQAREQDAGKTGELSPFDGIIRRYSERYGLDWRLMAAQAFQESRFDPTAQSWVGARGLFQVMPLTGKELGFIRLDDPEQGTHAGIKYMSKLLAQLQPDLPLKQRVRFALAAYNVGLGHVLDAQRLAESQKLDPNKWFGNVEKAMLLLQRPAYARRARHGYCRGAEPVKYVSEIQTRYDGYVKLVP